MAILTVKSVVSMERNSFLPEDRVVNTFYWFWSGVADPVSTDYDDLRDRLVFFYNSLHLAQTADIASRISEAMSRVGSANKIYFYSVPDEITPAIWGSPVATRSWTLDAAAAGTPLPSEVACVLSFHGDLTDVPETQANPSPPPAIIRPASRQRGRIYLGPLQSGMGVEDSVSHEFVPGSTFLSDVALAATRLATPFSDWEWRVQSNADQNNFPVVGGFIDGEFDTQRRRGFSTNNRVTFTA